MEDKVSIRRKRFYKTTQVFCIILIILNVLGYIFSDVDTLQAQYTFNAAQCLMMFVVLLIPTVFEKNIKLIIPEFMQIIFLLFCFCHFILGEVAEFYLHVNSWDSMLHFLSGAMIAIVGFCLVGLFNNSERIGVTLSPFFLAFFSVCFAVFVGVIWEIYEFWTDVLFGTNMQRFMDSVTGEIYIGQEALYDTMKDLMLDTGGALLIAVIFLLNNSFRDKIFTQWQFKRKK